MSRSDSIEGNQWNGIESNLIDQKKKQKSKKITTGVAKMFFMILTTAREKVKKSIDRAARSKSDQTQQRHAMRVDVIDRIGIGLVQRTAFD
jgi:hypothetical protein